MPDDVIRRVDLVLKGQVAKIPITVNGSLEDGKLGEITGSVEIDKTLNEFLDALGGGFEEAADLLRRLAGGGDALFRLDSLAFGYRNAEPAFAQLVVTMTAAGNQFRFVLLKMKGREFVVGLDLKWDPSLFDDNILSGLVGKISLGDLGLYFASNAVSNIRFDPARDFGDVTALNVSESAMQGRSFNKGLNLAAQVSVGSLNLLDFLGDSGESGGRLAPAANQQPVEQGGTPEHKQLTKLSTHWVKLDKTIGPLFIRRIGFGYEKPRVMLLLDGGVNLSKLVLTLLGFGISYPLDKITIDIEKIVKALRFHLDGASLALDLGPVAIAGGLLKVSDKPLQLDGTLMLRIGSFNLGAIGSYADMCGMPSLFIFAAFQQIFGGPPYFVVAGLAFGFGINRALDIPPMEGVASFPLVKAATDPFYLGTDLDLRDISDKLGRYIYPSVGNFWMAAGLKFISFGVINGFVLATVSVGVNFQVALLGLAGVRMPPQPSGAPKVEPVASAELALKVCISLSSGVLAVEGQLTENSFILSRQCRLTGGFAFNVWFNPPHLGDFVISLGGYHPRFQPPAHYPKVPRLGLQWSISKHLSINGGIYFALTPSCCMAGGRLDAVFAMGGLRAWFQAYADFLISWKPFFYDTVVGVAIGVSYTLRLLGISTTLSVELSARVHLWGPAFGGIAKVKWYIISFDIGFGDTKRVEPGPLDWLEFHQSFLPQPESGTTAVGARSAADPEITRIHIATGLIREQKRKGEDSLRVVNGHQFAFTTEAAMPCTELLLNDRPVATDNVPNPATLGIKPMGIVSLHAEHRVVVEKLNRADDGWDAYLRPETRVQGMPKALWSSDLARPKKPSAEHIENVPNGLTVTLAERLPNHPLAFMDLEKFRYENIPQTIDWGHIPLIPRRIPAPVEKTLMNTIWGDDEVDARRERILRVLNEDDLGLQAVEVPELAANATRIFQMLPSMAVPGEAL